MKESFLCTKDKTNGILGRREDRLKSRMLKKNFFVNETLKEHVFGKF